MGGSDNGSEQTVEETAVSRLWVSSHSVWYANHEQAPSDLDAYAQRP
jgi:hypothetical protein